MFNSTTKFNYKFSKKRHNLNGVSGNFSGSSLDASNYIFLEFSNVHLLKRINYRINSDNNFSSATFTKSSS